MTFAPAPLRALGAFLVQHGAVNLGIVGDTAHQAKGFSYHLGKDHLKPGASSATLPRDKAGLSDAASAIDIGKVGGSIQGLRTMSLWLVAQCQAGAPDTADIREVIFSADGQRVDRWDGQAKLLRQGPGQGDNSHRTHTHISFFRDSETRDKVSLFRRYFEEADVRITAIKGEDWLPTADAAGQSNGVLRATPDRTAPVEARIPLGTKVRSIAEVSANGGDWRLTRHLGGPAYMLRSDWTPVVQGGDAAVNARLTDYIDRVGD